MLRHARTAAAAPSLAVTLAVTFAATLAACGAPAPPAPTKVSESTHVLAEPQRVPRDPDSPFRRPDREKPLPRSEPQIPPDQLTAALDAAAAARAVGNHLGTALALYPCANKVPQHIRCEGELGMALAMEPNRRFEANYYLEQAIAQDDPTADADFYRRMAEALRLVPLFREAGVAYERMIARTPAPVADDFARLAEVLQGVPDREAEAAAALHKAFELDPTRLEFLRDEGLLLAQIFERRAEALAILTRYREAVATSAPDKAAAIDRNISNLQYELEKDAPPTPPETKAGGAGRRRNGQQGAGKAG